MSVIDPFPIPVRDAASEGQRFIFSDVDWELYEFLGRKLGDQRIFTTYYKGKLEVGTVGFQHERIVSPQFVTAGLTGDDTSWSRSFRSRVREAIAAKPA